MVVVVPDAVESQALARGLQERGLEVWYEGWLAPGTDREASLREALKRCVLVVVALVDGLDEVDRGVIAAAIAAGRADPSRLALAPVRVSGTQEVYGLNILQEGRWGDEELVDRLAQVAQRRLVVDPEERVRVLVIAHPEEGAADVDKVVNKLALKSRVHKPVERRWLDAADLAERLRGADRALLVLGGKVDLPGLEVLRRLVVEGGVRVFPRNVDQRVLDEDELDLQSARRKVLRGLAVGAEVDGDALVQAINQDLDAWMTERFQGDPAASLRPWEREWLEVGLREWRAGRHGGLIKQTTGQMVSREDLYVPGVAEAAPWRRRKDGCVRWAPVDDGSQDVTRMGTRLERVIARRAAQAAADEEGPTPGEQVSGENKTADPTWIDELVALPQLRAMVIQGEAGTGKTVLLQHLATVIAARHLDEEVAEAQRVDVAALAQGVPLLPIPVWVEARVLADRVRERGSAQPIVTLIAELLAPCGPVHVADVEQGLKDGRYLLLVDARDEVTADGLAALDRALVQIARTRPKTRVIVTTRPAAHTGSVLGAPFVTVNLAMLDDERRSRMVDRWCGAQRATWPERDTELREAVRLLADRLQGEAGDPLSNPLFLTCAMIRFEVDHRLPDDRADLIDRLIDMLCMSRGVADREGDSDRRRREAARAVAWALQRSGGTALGVDDAARAVQKALGLEKERDGVVALDRLAAHTMIFRFEEQAGRRVVRPWHRTFQELLAAEADLARGDGVEVVYTRWSAEGWLDDPRWEGCVRLMAGVLATRSREEAHLWVDALLGEDRADVRQRGRRLALLADAVAEERTRCWEDGDPGLGRYARAVMERYAAEGREYGWKDRLVLLEGLGRMATARSLGTRGEEGTVDPRFPDLRWDRSRWVAVEGGRYRVGDGPPREVDVGAFELLDTPVLVQDWRPFVESGAWEDPRFRLAGSPPPERVPEWVGQRRYPNRPVWGVDWYDAVAFCRWATEAWALPAGAVVALPTAVEWEVAARGRGGDRYPWGNQAEPGREEEAQACYDWGWRPFRGPAPVGVFPAGARERLLDLAGNVWEWTDSRFSEDGAGDDTRLSAPDTGVSGGDRIVSRVSPDAAPRVVRGGSWSGDARWLRAAIRSGRHPHLRNRHLGFRVCVRREPGR